MKKYFYALFFVFHSAWGASDLNSLLALTRERLPLIQAHRAEAERAEAAVSQSSTLANPSLMVQAGSLKTGTFNGDVIDLTLMQPLPWPGKREALKHAEEARSKMLLIDTQAEILQVEHLVVQTAARIAGLKEMAKHVSERRHRFEMLRKSLAARPQLSPIQQVERGLIENQLRMLERGIVMLETEQHTLERMLSIWLGQSVELKINWDHVPALLPREEWEAKVAEQNPTLKKISAQKSMAQAELRSAELAAYPDWQVGANYREERMAPTNHFYHAMVGITLPIFDRGQHKESMAKAEMNVLSARQEFTRQQVLAQISQAWEEAQAQTKLLKTFNHNLIKESEKRFHIAEVEFSKGRIDAPTFLATDAQIHESVDASFQTTLDALAAINRLRLMVGLSPEI